MESRACGTIAATRKGDARNKRFALAKPAWSSRDANVMGLRVKCLPSCPKEALGGLFRVATRWIMPHEVEKT